MKGPEFLQQHVGKLNSRMGGVVPGSHAAIRGLDLHSTFEGAEWVDLFVFAHTGRRLTPNQLRLIQNLWIYSSYPDARIWNNRVAALGGTTRSTASLAISAALAVSEATIYGRGIDIRAISFLREALCAVSNGATIADCVRNELDSHRGIAGFGRPLTAEDERIRPTLALAARLDLGGGPHIRLAFDIDDHLNKGRWRMRINFGAVAAALMADMGFSAREYYLCAFPTFLAGMLPCYMEASEQPEGAFLPIPCDDVMHSGHEPRIWATSRKREP